MSARAPAGNVNRKKGSDATVDISDIKSGDAVSRFIETGRSNSAEDSTTGFTNKMAART